ncbi:unnamed protein product [Colias eurytheme]|nr:unnamed protein product [Colias eurytheme]
MEREHEADPPMEDAEQDPPAWLRWFGVGNRRKGPVHPVFIPQAPAAQREEAIQATRAAQDLAAQLTPFNLDSAVSFLNVRMYEQKITGRYRAQCAKILMQEMDRQGLRNLHSREAIVRGGVELHIERKLLTRPSWTYSGIQQVNKFNKAINGIAERRHPWFYWKTQTIQLSSPLNSSGPWQEESSFRASHILAPLAITAGITIGLATAFYQRL